VRWCVGLLQITSVEPVYDQYNHLVAIKVVVKNAGDKAVKATIRAHVSRVVSKGRFSKKEEHGSSEPAVLDLAPGAEHALEMIIHPAISVSKEFSIAVSGAVEEVSSG